MDTRTRLKIKTIYGKLLTIDVEEETSEYISGKDKFGAFVKVPKNIIESCEPERREE
jgi:hypothetical protein